MSTRNKNTKSIALCASLSFYKDLFEIEKRLKNLGYSVIIPKTARKMRKTGNFDVASHKTWFVDENDYEKKRALMDDHFRKIIKSDAILVVNNESKGIPGYIGGNVLMEMAIAYQYKKPIFILNSIDSTIPIIEEVKAMGCVILENDLSKIMIKAMG